MRRSHVRSIASLGFGLLCLSGLQVVSNAQTFSIASYFGPSGSPVLYCSGNDVDTVLSDNILYLNTLQGSVSSQMTQVAILGLKATSQAGYTVKYATITSLGYWYATGSQTGEAVQVISRFTQLASGQGNLRVTISDYYTGTLVYSSGTLSLQAPSALTIVASVSSKMTLQDMVTVTPSLPTKEQTTTMLKIVKSFPLKKTSKGK